ncbi:related to thiamin pyrophosphokinase [Fusarium torulosum]|uniref:Related to thiamin pyrophosphokinase n=1 Tax=Fusarium torulosum TaxID=33205 RepID=A0AAE8SKH0_9HYPO|nr:related to thiamin pyrophosphokinase [Fusarium torulosum]
MTTSTGPSRKLLDLITAIDSAPLDFGSNYAPYYRLFLSPDPRPHGFILPATVSLMPWPKTFTIDHDSRSVTLSEPPSTSTLTEHASSSFQQAVDKAVDNDLFPILNKEHSEYFRVVGARSFVQIERFSAPLFGIATRGAHLTGYVRGNDGRIKIWVARRSRHLFSYPGLLDSTVAGGIKASDAPLACIKAESTEEACLPPDLVSSRVEPAGVITLANINSQSKLFHPEIIYVFDLDMPSDVVPTPGDDEVEEFVLMDCGEVVERMLKGEFKPEVCPVMIDFLVRRGFITKESEGDFEEIQKRLRREIPVPMESDV